MKYNFINQFQYDMLDDPNTGAYKDVDGDWVEYQKSPLTQPKPSVSEGQDWKGALLNVRNELYDSIPVGELEVWGLLKAVTAHIRKLDVLIDSATGYRQEKEEASAINSEAADVATLRSGFGNSVEQDDEPAYSFLPQLFETAKRLIDFVSEEFDMANEGSRHILKHAALMLRVGCGCDSYNGFDCGCGTRAWLSNEALALLNSDQNVQVSDTTEDDSNSSAHTPNPNPLSEEQQKEEEITGPYWFKSSYVHNLRSQLQQAEQTIKELREHNQRLSFDLNVGHNNIQHFKDLHAEAVMKYVDADQELAELKEQLAHLPSSTHKKGKVLRGICYICGEPLSHPLAYGHHPGECHKIAFTPVEVEQKQKP